MSVQASQRVAAENISNALTKLYSDSRIGVPTIEEMLLLALVLIIYSAWTTDSDISDEVLDEIVDKFLVERYSRTLDKL